MAKTVYKCPDCGKKKKNTSKFCRQCSYNHFTIWNKGKHPEYLQGKNHPMYGKSHIAWNKGLKGFMMGEKNGNWKGGIS
jgi:uncharacterized membrane protein YvbJ